MKLPSQYINGITSRSLSRFILGLIPRTIKYLKYSFIKKIAISKGAQIGEYSIIPFSLAKKANKNLVIGKHSIISTSNFSSFRYPITIKDNVIIGKNAKLVLGGHNIDSPHFEHCRNSPPLIIEDYVWICPDSVILPSCSHIGKGAVIGANAVVTKDVPEFSIMSGNPAKEIRKRKETHHELVTESELSGDCKSYIYARKQK